MSTTSSSPLNSSSAAAASAATEAEAASAAAMLGGGIQPNVSGILPNFAGPASVSTSDNFASLLDAPLNELSPMPKPEQQQQQQQPFISPTAGVAGEGMVPPPSIASASVAALAAAGEEEFNRMVPQSFLQPGMQQQQHTPPLTPGIEAITTTAAVVARETARDTASNVATLEIRLKSQQDEIAGLRKQVAAQAETIGTLEGRLAAIETIVLRQQQPTRTLSTHSSMSEY